MRPRFLAVALVLILVVPAQAARRRAVRSPGPDCTYSLAVGFATPVISAGLVDGVIQVTGSSAICTGWAAYSSVDWITLQRDGTNVRVIVQPNETASTRAALITVAGISFQITQSGATISPPIVPGNLLQNGSFALDLSHWGWQDRFPNGTGDASWSRLDANGSIASGSMLLRDDVESPSAFNRSQCIEAQPGFYDYGFALRSSSPAGARAIIAMLEFDTRDCSGSYPAYAVRNIELAEAGVWEQRTFTEYLNDDKVALMIIVGGYARQSGIQEVWVDDVFVRRREVP